MKIYNKIRNYRELKVGLGIVLIYFLWAISWYLITHFFKGSISEPYEPLFNLKSELLAPFQKGFLLGTDVYGRSILEVLSQGLLYSLVISIIVSFSAAAIGTIVGYLSVRGIKFFEKFFELMTNIVFIFPSILIAIVVMSFSGNSVVGLVGTLIFTGWPGYSRIVRGETKRILGLSYVESSIALGASEFRLFSKIVLPNVIPQLLVHIVLGMSGVIMSEASLGFLGLGGSEYSWGSLLSMSKNVLLEAPFLVLVLSLVMAGIIIGFNLLGDGLRDFLDPKTKVR